tara:strand:+ start:52 stop:879 length:828 start_codon:yes stop_codon:yes gene_type:complete
MEGITGGLSSLLSRAKSFIQDAVQQQRDVTKEKRAQTRQERKQEQIKQEEPQELSIYNRLNTPVSKEQGERLTNESIAKSMELVNSLDNKSGIAYGKLPSIIKHTAMEESGYGTNPLTYEKREITYTDNQGVERTGTVGHGGIGQVTYGRTKQLLTGDERARDVKELVKKFEEQTGQKVSDIVKDKESMDAFLEVPFNSIFLSTLQYVDALGNEKLAREALRKGVPDSVLRDVFYSGRTSRKALEEQLNKIKEVASKNQGGMVDRDPYKRQPRFI